MDRRRFLSLLGVVGATVTAGCGGADAPEEPQYGDWFDPVDNFDGFADRTDTSTVTVRVGAGERGWQFDPAAITVTPGTTVTFEWTGDGGEHNVEHADGDWQNPDGVVGQAGHTWQRTFDEPGTHRFRCWPHDDLGMRGAIFVDAHTE